MSVNSFASVEGADGGVGITGSGWGLSGEGTFERKMVPFPYTYRRYTLSFLLFHLNNPLKYLNERSVNLLEIF